MGKGISSAIREKWLGWTELLQAPSTEPRFRWRWVWIPLAITAAGTALGRLTEFDMGMATAIYRAGGETWAFGEISLWWFLYRYGTIPGALAGILAAVGFILSWSRDGFRKWRRVFLYLFLVIVVASGVVANFILKGYWGRPRPRQVEELGGTHEFETILAYNAAAQGKSFPCGHATAAFYFFCGFFLLRRYSPAGARFFLLFGLLFGSFMGIARMTQGAHFFTDVVWAGAICWFVAMGLYYLLRLDRSLTGVYSKRALPLWGKVTALALGIALLLGVLLASPYSAKRDLFITKEFAKSGPLELGIILTEGRVSIKEGDHFHARGEEWGHGLPTSDIGQLLWEQEREGMSDLVVYKEDRSGWFTELEKDLVLEVPWHRLEKLWIETDEAEIQMKIPAFEGTRILQVTKGTSDLPIRIIGGQKVTYLEEEKKSQVEWASGTDSAGSEGSGELQLSIADEFKGRLLLRR